MTLFVMEICVKYSLKISSYIRIALVCCLGAYANCICTVAIFQIPVTKIIDICNKMVNTLYICTIMDVILVPFAPLCSVR